MSDLDDHGWRCWRCVPQRKTDILRSYAQANMSNVSYSPTKEELQALYLSHVDLVQKQSVLRRLKAEYLDRVPKDEWIVTERKKLGLTADESDDIFIPAKFKILVIRPGGEKTTSIHRFLKQIYKKQKHEGRREDKHLVLWVSPRVAFTYFVQITLNDLDPTMYFEFRECEGLKEAGARFLIVSPESFHLVMHTYKTRTTMGTVLRILPGM